MWRLLALGLAWFASCVPVWAADPNQVLQTFFGIAQQLEAQERQARERQQALIQQLVTACANYNEPACHQIIDTKGMSPHANYTAFVRLGDIELGRGERAAAHTSYTHALRWANRMSGGAAARRVERKLAALAAADGAPAPRPPEPPASTPSQPTVAATASRPNSDPVCDAATSVDWKIACLRASQAGDGAQLHAALTTSLRTHNTTLQELLRCEAVLKDQPAAGLACYEGRGLTGEHLQEARINALEYELLIEEAQQAPKRD
jgi:hypothetical protein